MKIAIAGYGLEGEANYKYWNLPGNELTIVDENESPSRGLPEGVDSVLGQGSFSELGGFDLVIRTAGLDPSKIKTDGKIWSSTNEFFDKCPAPIIGVTGSKGKGTTASLAASVLREAGKTVHLVGNIGVSGLEVLGIIQPSDIVVYELSSFQLWDIEKSPHTAVVLFIEPEHLDVHHSFDDYVSAKSNIVRFQSSDDVVIFNKNNNHSMGIAEQSSARSVPYQDEHYAHVADDWFWYGEQKLCSVHELKLNGRHNLDNACAAIDAVWQYLTDTDAIAKGFYKFNGLPHRLKLVRDVRGIKFYDDSIATTPGSAIAALDAFIQPKILILGGSSKKADFTELAQKISSSNVRTVILIGAEAVRIQACLDQVQFGAVVNLGDDVSMQAIVGKSIELAKEGDVVILSPACASFGMFKNYTDRGDQFIEAVDSLTN